MTLFDDLRESLKRPSFWIYSSWIELLLRYRATSLGPVWIVMNIVVFVSVLGALYSRILNFDLSTYLPHLALSMAIWTYLSSILVQGCNIYRINRGFIMNGNTRITDYVLKLVALHGVTLLHNAVIVVIVFLLCGVSLGWNFWWAIVGMALVLINSIWVGAFLGFLGARYSDLAEMVSAGVRIAFFVTPIVWMPHTGIRASVEPFLILNPFYHFIEIVRAPILENRFPGFEFAVVLVVTIVGFTIASAFYRRFRDVVVLWI